MVICAGPATPLSCCDLVFGECNKELSSGAGSGLVVGEGTEGEGEGKSLARLPCTLLQALLGNVYVWCWHGGAVCVRPSAMYSCVCMWQKRTGHLAGHTSLRLHTCRHLCGAQAHPEEHICQPPSRSVKGLP